jgi:predicted transcriptional regulator
MLRIEASNHLDLTAGIVSAYVSNNRVFSSDLGGLISVIHQTLGALEKPLEPAAKQIEKPTSVQIKKSIQPDALISFLDRRSYKTLKRHLRRHGLDPQAYRERFGLPPDYPMVSSNYAAQRSALAKSMGLGRPRSQETEDSAPEGEVTEAPKGRGRPRKAA